MLFKLYEQELKKKKKTYFNIFKFQSTRNKNKILKATIRHKILKATIKGTYIKREWLENSH